MLVKGFLVAFGPLFLFATINASAMGSKGTGAAQNSSGAGASSFGVQNSTSKKGILPLTGEEKSQRKAWEQERDEYEKELEKISLNTQNASKNQKDEADSYKIQNQKREADSYKMHLASIYYKIAAQEDSEDKARVLLEKGQKFLLDAGEKGEYGESFAVTTLLLAGLAPKDKQADFFKKARERLREDVGSLCPWATLMDDTAKHIKLASWSKAYYREIVRTYKDDDILKMSDRDRGRYASVLLRAGFAVNDPSSSDIFSQAEELLKKESSEPEKETDAHRLMRARFYLEMIKVWQLAMLSPDTPDNRSKCIEPLKKIADLDFEREYYTYDPQYYLLFKFFFEGLEEKLQNEPWFWGAWGVVEAYSSRYVGGGGEEGEGDEKFEKALALAPKNAEIWLAWAEVGKNARSEEEVATLADRTERSACYSGDNASSWFYWNKFFDRKDRFYIDGDKRHFTLPDMENICPSFLSFAKAQILFATERRGNRASKTEEGLALLEKAIKFPHPKDADILIYGAIGFNKETLARRADDKVKDETFKLYEQAYAAFLTSWNAYKAAYKADPQGYSTEDYSWVDRFRSVISHILKDPSCPLAGESFDNMRKIWLELQAFDFNNRKIKEVKSAEQEVAWASELYSDASAWGTKGTEHGVKLLDLALSGYEKAAPEPSDLCPAWYLEWADALNERSAMSSEDGVSYTQKAIKIANEYLEKNPKSGKAYKMRALSRVALAAQSKEKAGLALLREAYTDFALSAGLPENSNLARVTWAGVLMDQPNKKETPEFFKTEVKSILKKAGLPENMPLE